MVLVPHVDDSQGVRGSWLWLVADLAIVANFGWSSGWMVFLFLSLFQLTENKTVLNCKAFSKFSLHIFLFPRTLLPSAYWFSQECVQSKWTTLPKSSSISPRLILISNQSPIMRDGEGNMYILLKQGSDFIALWLFSQLSISFSIFINEIK